jgi:hypothetical protein
LRPGDEPLQAENANEVTVLKPDLFELHCTFLRGALRRTEEEFTLRLVQQNHRRAFRVHELLDLGNDVQKQFIQVDGVE